LDVEEVLISSLPDIEDLLDSQVWTRNGNWTLALTVRGILDHAKRIHEADLSYPIILTPKGRVADGIHRLVRALLEDKKTILAVRLLQMPEPLSAADFGWGC
jgi:hypothetical protein